ncbi:MAG: DUF86 domain-containing protein [Bacteroidota bacterium]|nr:DUF86 domain-containing protein [Chitinophagaceae bacterium]MDZ4808648.1 DUF86 domain-containing protein [Bacteroidota bacterium]
MSERDLLLLLEDITFSINHIFDYTQELSFEQYEQDQKTKDAVERNFMIIGEAVSRIPDDFKSQHEQIEWRIIKDFRNFIIHEYFGINNMIVWDTIVLRLPDLQKDFQLLIQLLGKERSDS